MLRRVEDSARPGPIPGCARPRAARPDPPRGAQNPSRASPARNPCPRRAAVLDDFEHAAGHLGVERAGRLVEKEQARLDGDGACDGHALALPAAEFRRFFVTRARRDENGSGAAMAVSLRLVRATWPYTFSSGSVTFCNAVRCGNRLYAWKTVPMVRRCRASSGSRKITGSIVDGHPARCVGYRDIPAPPGHAESVDFPPPDGPMSTRVWTASKPIEMPVEHTVGAKGFRDVFDVEFHDGGIRFTSRKRPLFSSSTASRSSRNACGNA